MKTWFIERTLMENIKSLNPKLKIRSICSLRTRSGTRDIFEMPLIVNPILDKKWDLPVWRIKFSIARRNECKRAGHQRDSIERNFNTLDKKLPIKQPIEFWTLNGRFIMCLSWAPIKVWYIENYIKLLSEHILVSRTISDGPSVMNQKYCLRSLYSNLVLG